MQPTLPPWGVLPLAWVPFPALQQVQAQASLAPQDTPVLQEDSRQWLLSHSVALANFP